MSSTCPKCKTNAVVLKEGGICGDCIFKGEATI